MVVLNDLNLATRHADFHCDNESEIVKLPTRTSKGKDEISSISPVSPGSYCFCGKTASLFYLDGDSNTWELVGGE